MSLRRSFRTVFIALLLAGLCAACASHEDWEPGSLYSVTGEDGSFSVVKVLARDAGVVSVRLYREEFPSRPTAIAADGLSVGALDDPEGFGIGHLPLTERDFALWFPVLIEKGTVSEDELDGYRIWKESGAGAFSLSASEEEDDD